MRIVRLERLTDASDATRGAAATLGMFDGVHLGHQRILARTRAMAAQLGTTSTVLTFAVHPVVVVRGLPPRLITSLPHRLRLFERAGIDECVVLPFDEQVRAMTAQEFADLLFGRVLALRGLVLGPDARIGRDRGGDLAFLRAWCERNGVALEVVEALRSADVDGAAPRISSTRVRAAIADGDLVRARRMLGRGVTMLGTVVQGLGRGRTLGFATANLDLHHEIRPPAGVYAIRARAGGSVHPGVLNIGIRPTFGPDGDLTVEAHLLDFDGDLYGRDLEVELVERIRDERSFASRDELVAQIARDVADARRILGGR